MRTSPVNPPGSRSIRNRARMAGWMLVIMAAGCAEQPYAAEFSRPLSEEPLPWKARLTPQEQAEAAEAMRAATDTGEAMAPVRFGPTGLQWSDVPAAARAACEVDEDRPGRAIEMAVVSIEEQDRQFVIRLETIEGWPATLVVMQTGDESVYDRLATVGLFPEREAAIRRARALEAAFDREMQRLAEKLRPPVRAD